MKEKTFRVPTIHEILELNRISHPEKLSDNYFLSLLDNNTLIPVGNTYEEAFNTIENLPEKKIALFPSSFRTTSKESNLGIKSLEDLLKIDSQQVLRQLSPNSINPPRQLTQQFLESNKITPESLIKTALETGQFNLDSPPIGFYWIGTDGRARATSWLRSSTAAEMMIMQKRGDFTPAEILDRTTYARNLRVQVNSRTEENVTYGPFTLSRLPMHYENEKDKYSYWKNLSHNSPDPDASYRGEEHEKRKQIITLFSTPVIYAFYSAMVFVNDNSEIKRKFRINPFPIPTNPESISYIDKLRIQSIIMNPDENSKISFKVLNKTEIDKMIGARTLLRGYSNCFHHWSSGQKKDLSYLYTPLPEQLT